MEGPVAEAYVQSNDNLAIADDVVFEKVRKKQQLLFQKRRRCSWKNQCFHQDDCR